MGKKANPKVIGIFVLGAIALSVVGVLVFGGGQFLIEKRKLVMYFESSVKGLNVGSAILFRGVKIGEVSDIQAEFHREKLDIRIPVFVDMQPDKFKSIGITKDLTEEERTFLIGTLIERGLRATLEIQSLVTGQKAISLQFMPGTPVKLIGGHKDMIEIPTIETGLEKFTKKIEDLPLQELAKSAISALGSIDDAVKDVRKLTQNIDAQIDPISSSVVAVLQEATTTLRDAKKLVGNVDTQVEPIASKTKNLLDQAKDAVNSAGGKVGDAAEGIGKLASSIDRHIDPVGKKIGEALLAAQSALTEAKGAFAHARDASKPNSPLRYKLESALTDISAATRSVRALADLLERKPSSLLAGRGDEGKLYVLTSMPKSTKGFLSMPAIKKMAIAIGPMEMPYHLDRPQIVTGSKGTELRVNQVGQWAGELRENFTRVLQENLSTILSSEKIYSFPSDFDQKIDVRVKLMVNQVEAQPQGKSLLNVKWSIIDHDKNKVLLSKESKFEEKATSLDFAGSVAALSKNVANLSLDIAQGIISISKKIR